METELKDLVGRRVLKIFMNEEYLKFETDKGSLVYEVSGDCCSHSYFFDFYGVKKLIENGIVTDVRTVDVAPGDDNTKHDYDDCIQYYGYQITTENKELGEQTSVFSFRNSSNGYYGGSIDKVENGDMEVLPEITEDISEVK